MITSDDKIVALIDGDIIAYLAAAVCDDGDQDEVIQAIRNFVTEWAQSVGATKTYVFVSEGENFRHKVYPDYKQNRVGKPVPRFARGAKDWMLENYEQILSNPDLEADDRLCLYATEDHGLDEVRVIVTTDKDMKQCPGYVYNPDYSVFPDRYTPEECMQMLFFQWACGDSVDGYKGIPNFGVEKYRKWVHKTMEDSGLDTISSRDVIALYDSKGQDPDYCIQMLYCAAMKNHGLPDHLNSLDHRDFDPDLEFYTTIGETRFWRGVKAKV